ncbi:hypothetical protein [Streptomyces sp. NPDC058268]
MKLKGPSCTEVQRDAKDYIKPGENVAFCFDSKPPKNLARKKAAEGTKSETKDKQGGQGANGGGAVWCDTSGQNNTAWSTRTQLCAVHDNYIVVVNKNGAPIGYAEGTVKQEITTHIGDTNFEEYFYYGMNGAIGGAKDLKVKITAACRPSSVECHQGSGPWEGAVPIPVGSSRDGTWLREWTETTGHRSLELVYTLEISLSNGVETGSGTASWGYNTLDEWKVRCDNEVATYAGCVVEAYTPTLVVKEKYNEARQFIGMVQSSMSTHPGWQGHGEPLHREADEAVAKKNRAVICDSTFTANPSTPKPAQCDEFPFAKSKESGRQSGVTSGKVCQQYYVLSSIIEGKEYLSLGWPGSNQGTMPSASAKCARASMPKVQNEGVGGDLGRLTTSQRILNGDAYWVDAGNDNG